MINLWSLFFPLISGVFFLIGFFVVRYVKEKQNLSILSTSMAFLVMIGMLFFDLFPEILEHSESFIGNDAIRYLSIFLFVGFGFFILKLFDIFLPHHHHEHHEKEDKEDLEEHNHHMYHVGFILSISLILHNILEGMSIYLVTLESISSGLLFSIGVGLHNLPLGIEIASNFNERKNKKLNLLLFLLVISSFLGATLMIFFGKFISDIVLYILLSIACGMILYIAFFELFIDLKGYLNSKYTYIGFLIGLFLMIFMFFLE